MVLICKIIMTMPVCISTLLNAAFISSILSGIVSNSFAQINKKFITNNSVEMLGSNITLRLMHKECLWNLIYPDQSEKTIFNSERVANNKYQVNRTDPGQCDLTIIGLSYDDGGLYHCGSGEGSAIHLIIADAQAKCEVHSGINDDPVIYGQRLTVSCSISMSTLPVDPSKKFFWFQGQSKDIMKSDGQKTSTQVTNYTTLTSSFEVTADKSMIESYQCLVSVHGTSPVHLTAENVAKNSVEFSSTCHTEAITVFYPVRNIRIFGDIRRSMRLGEILTCAVEVGTQPVQYYWTEEDVNDITVIVQQGSQLQLNSTGLHRYTCTAANVIGRMTYTTSMSTPSNIFVESSGQQNPASAESHADSRAEIHRIKSKLEEFQIAISVLVAFVLLCILCILLFLFRKYIRCCMTDKSVEGDRRVPLTVSDIRRVEIEHTRDRSRDRGVEIEQVPDYLSSLGSNTSYLSPVNSPSAETPYYDVNSRPNTSALALPWHYPQVESAPETNLKSVANAAQTLTGSAGAMEGANAAVNSNQRCKDATKGENLTSITSQTNQKEINVPTQSMGYYDTSANDCHPAEDQAGQDTQSNGQQNPASADSHADSRAEIDRIKSKLEAYSELPQSALLDSRSYYQCSRSDAPALPPSRRSTAPDIHANVGPRSVPLSYEPLLNIAGAALKLNKDAAKRSYLENNSRGGILPDKQHGAMPLLPPIGQVSSRILRPTVGVGEGLLRSERREGEKNKVDDDKNDEVYEEI